MTTMRELLVTFSACARKYATPSSFAAPGRVDGGESFVPVVMACNSRSIGSLHED